MSQDPRITTGELLLRRALKTASAPPFVAHAQLSERTQQALIDGLRKFVGGKADRIPASLDLFPAAASWLIASTLLENYGLATHRIYEPISASFGVPDIPNHVRLPLNRAFRKACTKLGLIVAADGGTGYVDDYVLQAGVAKSQQHALVEAFVRAEAVIGRPDEEDTQRLNAWEDRASDFASSGLTRLRNILRWDQSAYHAGVYARARRDVPPQTPFETEIGDLLRIVLEDTKFQRTAADEPLRLLFLDDALVLRAPAASGVHVRFPDREKWIGPGRQLNLAAPWPETLFWRREGADSAQAISLVAADRPGLLFDVETGALLRSLSTADIGKPIALPVSQIVILSLKHFRVGENESIDLGPKAHGLIVDIGRGIEVSLDGKQFILKPPLRPSIEMVAAIVGRGKGGGLLASPSLIRIRFANGRPEGQLSLQIEHPAITKVISRELPPGEDIEIDISGDLDVEGPAGPLRVSVGFGENSRVLVRASNWVWPGLKSLKDGVSFDGPIPPNLDFAQSSYIIKTEWNQASLDVSADYRCATLAFHGAGNEAKVFFDVIRPGTTIALADEDGTERSIQPGTRLSIVAGSTSTLVIRSDDAEAALDIRGVIHATAFGRSGVRRIGLASLVGPAPHSHIRLLPRGEEREARDLIEVVSATAPTAFHVERDRRAGQLVIRADFDCVIDAVQLIVTDLAGSDDVVAECALGRYPVENPATSLIEGDIELATACSSRVVLRLASEDCWAVAGVGELAVRTAGDARWRPLRNTRGDSFSVILADTLPHGELVVAKADALGFFLRLTDTLNRCYAAECWGAVQQLQRLWRQLGVALSHLPDGRQALLQSWGRPLPLDVSSTWVPLRHPIEIAPALLDDELSDWAILNGAEDEFAELSRLADLSGIAQPQDALRTLNVSPTFYAAFDNFIQAATNPRVTPKGFDVVKFVKNSESENAEFPAFWRPSARRLTLRHHSWAIGRFIDRFELVSPTGQDLNGLRSQRLNQLINTVRRDERRLALPVPEGLADRLSLVEALPAFISAIAKAARWQRSEQHWQQLAAHVSRPLDEVLEDIGFLLRIAPDLMAFYLLLWELVRSTETQ